MINNQENLKNLKYLENDLHIHLLEIFEKYKDQKVSIYGVDKISSEMLNNTEVEKISNLIFKIIKLKHEVDLSNYFNLKKFILKAWENNEKNNIEIYFALKNSKKIKYFVIRSYYDYHYKEYKTETMINKIKEYIRRQIKVMIARKKCYQNMTHDELLKRFIQNLKRRLHYPEILLTPEIKNKYIMNNSTIKEIIENIIKGD